MPGIDKGIRFTNYLIDLSIIIIGWIGVSNLTQDSYLDTSLYYILSFFYYFFFRSNIRANRRQDGYQNKSIKKKR